jgi:hypothetical protein
MSSLIKILKTKVTSLYSISMKVDIALKRLIKKRTLLSYSLIRLYKLKSVVSRHKSTLFENCDGGVCYLCPGPAKCKIFYNVQSRLWKKLHRASIIIDDQIDSVILLGEALYDAVLVLKKD